MDSPFHPDQNRARAPTPGDGAPPGYVGTMTAPPAGRRFNRLIAGVTALLQIAAFLPYLGSAVIAPPVAVAMMQCLWAVFALLAGAVYRRNPPLSLAVPGLTVLTGVGILLLGARYLHWEG